MRRAPSIAPQLAPERTALFLEQRHRLPPSTSMRSDLRFRALHLTITFRTALVFRLAEVLFRGRVSI